MQVQKLGRSGWVGGALVCGLTWLAGCGSATPGTGGHDTKMSCAGDDECSVGVCDLESGDCVECLVDADCSDPERCSEGACDESSCVAGTSRCSEDATTILTCSADGSEEGSETCEPDGHCVEREGSAACSDWACAPNTFSCDGNELLLCSDDGAALSPFLSCDSSEYCDARRALCLPQICAPGLKYCDGAVLEVCNEEGSELSEETTCSLSEECSPEGCQPLLCVPNATFCSDGNVWQCSADATSSTMVEACGADRFCLEREGQAECSDHKCYPSDPVCNDGLATTCKPDGSGPRPGGEDCAANGQLCFTGQCRDQVCTPGEKLCDHEAVFLCADNGTDTALFKTCTFGEFCDPGSGACRTRICLPGSVGCSGTIVATCNASGSAYELNAVDCRDSGEVCDTGSCLPKVCDPNETTCIDGAVVACNQNGSAYGFANPCNSITHCVDTGTQAFCDLDVCTPGEPACRGNVISTCNEDGSAALPGGSGADCSDSGEVCDTGICKPQVCEPNELLCAGGDVQKCSATGAGYALERRCLSDTYCRLLDPTLAECRQKPCIPGATLCLAESYGTCASDGLSLATGASHCADAGETCTLQGCADEAVDQIAPPGDIESSRFGEVIFDQVHTLTPRRLKKIEAYLGLPAERTLRWVVYEKMPPFGVATLIFDQVTTSSGTAFHASQPLDLLLEADKDYFIGVRVTEGLYLAYVSPIPGRKVLSFGYTAGSGYAFFDTTLPFPTPAQATYAFRITTALP